MHVLFNRIELMFDICFGLATDCDPLLLIAAFVASASSDDAVDDASDACACLIRR